MNPFISFCLYVAARVFVQYLKSRPEDSQTADSLRFLLSAMNALKRRNPLTESFLVQLDVDLEALAVGIPKLKSAFPRSGDSVSIPSPPFSFGLTEKSQPGSKDGGARGPICDDPDGVQGIMSYRNECHFMKTRGDDGNAATAPNIVEPEQEGDTGPNSSSAGFGGQLWLSSEQPAAYDATRHGISTHGTVLTPNSGSLYDKSGSSSGRMTGFGQSESNGDNMSGSPDAEHSNRPTPGSSSASEQRMNMASNGSNSFDASPVSGHPNMNSQSNTEASVNFFNDATAFGIRGTGLTPNHRFSMPETPGPDFGMATNGWGDLQGQTGMTPVAEGVLRSLMSMGPMDAMDLSSWDASN